ncbi:MAG: hypothetical protein L0I76_28440 [Pseudonocardia sp.]|nr:hypothetical protein [Pseudonocardia sp.]
MPPLTVDDLQFFLRTPGLLDHLLEQHIDDGGGYCKACPGPQSGRHRWPCQIRGIAEQAEKLRDTALQDNTG